VERRVRPERRQREESEVSAVDDFEDAYGRLTNREAGVKGRLSNTLELLCDASELPDADVQRAGRRAIVKVGDAIEEQALLVLMAMENCQALPAEEREKAREGIEVLRELMALRRGERE
jgi:hypothetical protein